jgi:hypothetical protein
MSCQAGSGSFELFGVNCAAAGWGDRLILGYQKSAITPSGCRADVAVRLQKYADFQKPYRQMATGRS